MAKTDWQLDDIVTPADMNQIGQEINEKVTAAFVQSAITDRTLSNMARQALINGNFDVWQKETSFTNPSNAIYMEDRWRSGVSLTGIPPTTITHSQLKLAPGDIPSAVCGHRITTSGAGSGYGSLDIYDLRQRIEHGTLLLAGKKVTLSFWARSNISGKRIGCYLLQDYGSGGSPSATEDIAGLNWTLSSSWQKFTYTFDTNMITSKTFGTNNNDALTVVLSVLWGSDRAPRVGAADAETFRGAGYVDIAQIQLCVGENALPFQPKNSREEESDCLRFRWQSWMDSQLSSLYGSITGYAVSENALVFNTRFPVPMRITPTLTLINNNTVNQLRNTLSGSVVAVTPSGFHGLSNKGLWGCSFSGSPLTTGQYYDFDIIADAEL